MTDRQKTCQNKDFEQISTEHLNEMLQTELKKDLPDDSVVLPILNTLQEREKDYPVAIPNEVIDLWVEHEKQTHVESSKLKNKRGFMLRVAAVAAVICLILIAIPRTVGAGSVFQVLFRWTESVFEFLSPDDNRNDPQAEYVFESDNKGLQQLYNKMVAVGVNGPVVPMWMPDGYDLFEIKTTNSPEGEKIHAAFATDDRIIVITYRISEQGTQAQYEKKDESVRIYEYAGVQHCITKNDINLSVVWMNNGVECVLNVCEDEEIVRKIVASIY